MFQWILNENKGMRINSYLLSKSIQSTVIYGAGVCGELLWSVLNESEGISIVGFVDRATEKYPNTLHGLRVYSVEEINSLDEFDAVIITPYSDYYCIYNNIRKYNQTAIIISLEKIVYDLMIKGFRV